MTNHNLNFTGLPLSHNGAPNLRNDCVLAAMLDTLGTLYTATLNAVILRAQENGQSLLSDDEFTITGEEIQTLAAVQKGLRNFRDIVGRNNPSWGNRNLSELMPAILRETDHQQSEADREFIKMAEAILPMFYNDIKIGVADAETRDIVRRTEDAIREAKARIARTESHNESPSDAADRILRELNESGTIGGNRAV